MTGFLCDAATVREKLLHVLGGGITRLWKTQFPAQMDVSLALMLTLTQSEAIESHRLKVVVMDADGKIIDQTEARFEVKPGADVIPGEKLAVPIVMLMRSVIPREGPYGIDALVDGTLQRSFAFVAAKPPQKPTPA